MKFAYVLSAGVAAGALLELGVLPTFAEIVDYKLVAEGNFGAVTCSSGVMTGELGADDDAALGTELFPANRARCGRATGQGGALNSKRAERLQEEAPRAICAEE